jgi:hypothetical protein
VTDFDPAAPFPELVELRRVVQAHDWPAIEAAFAGMADPDDCEYAGRIVAAVKGSEDFLAECAAREPGTLARTLYAARLVAAGWEARTTYRANHVSAEQFATFHDHLRRAERVLIEVTAEEPGNATAWSSRIKINRGLELGPNEARRRYDRLVRHGAPIYAAQANLVQQFCPKWSGSFEKVHAFGLECLRAGPDGSLAALALVEAHLEIAFEEETDAQWRKPQTRAEVDEAAERSVRHPKFRAEGYHAMTAYNDFALVYTLLGDPAAARPYFEAARDVGVGPFWEYFGYFKQQNEATYYAAARKKAMKA